ncbi:MAG: radical SAM protein [Sphaerochaetaceae bacterium]|jgi:radical SAM protein with 4Fe4S-binding SPASM domain|nr:radical SAM protein [Sphaerochaetaceae bacterium]
MDQDIRIHSLDLLKQGKTAPVLILIRVSKICNAKCKMCDFWKETSKGHSIEKFSELIKSAKRLGTKRIRLTGGEPTIWPHFFEALDLIKKEGLESAFITNGLALNKTRCKEVIDAGVKQITFSINSATPKNHDYLIGIKGAWKRNFTALKNISKMRQNRNSPKITINFLLTRKNYLDLEKLIDLSKGKLFEEINIIPVRKVIELQLNPKNIKEYNESAKKILKKIKKLNIELTTKSPFVLGKLKKHRADSSKGLYASDFYEKNQCLACNYLLFIDSEGNVFPCNNTPYERNKFIIGNINEQSLEKIWNSDKIKKVRELAGKEPICQGCDYKNKLFNQLANKISYGGKNGTCN